MIEVRSLISTTVEDIYNNIGEDLSKKKVKFDDKTVLMTGPQIVVSRYLWDMFNLFPEINPPVFSTHAITGEFTAKKAMSILSKIFQHIWKSSGMVDKNVLWALSEKVLIVNNDLMVAAGQTLSRHTIMTSALDIVEILQHPEVMRVKTDLLAVANQTSDNHTLTVEIEKVNDVLEELLYINRTELMHNGIKKQCMSDTLSKGQVFQLLGVRGFIPDIDNKPYKYPMLGSYSEGMNDLYDHAIESRMAPFSLSMNGDPLKTSEWFNRRIQNVNSFVESIENEDCGSTTYVTRLVTDKDQYLFNNKYFLNEDTGKLQVMEDIKPFIGKMIKFRSATACANTNPQSICKTCFGMNHMYIPPADPDDLNGPGTANVGWSLTADLVEDLTQAMLSFKHFAKNLVEMVLEVNEKNSPGWLVNGNKDPGYIYFDPKVAKRRIMLYVDAADAKRINHLLSVTVDELSPTDITRCRHIWLAIIDADGQPAVPEELDTSLAGHGCHLTLDVLRYMKDKGWKLEPNNIISVDMTDFDKKRPILQTPKMGDNVQIFQAELQHFMLPTVTKGSKKGLSIVDCTSRSQAVNELINLMQKRFTVNMVEVEIWVRAAMCKVDSYEMPLLGEPYRFQSTHTILLKRTLSSMLFYGYQKAELMGSHPYLYEDHMPHGGDAVLS